MNAEQFVDHLLRSGLLTAEDLARFRATVLAGKARSANHLAVQLVRAGKLTPYQAQQVLAGKSAELVLGDYVVLEPIGAGGMGQVFKALHRTMDRVVAIKRMAPRMMRSPGAVERFRREVRAAARLVHPNIVTAYDAGCQAGTHYLVTEYVDGEDLGTLISRRGPLPIDEAVEYIVQAARGLEYAHQRGVVHRDVKPSNLLVDRSGNVKILDMGLVRIAETAQAAGGLPGDRLTQNWQVMGTCDYMAPEQAEDAHSADERSDIYSLGCTFFRLVTGRKPYRGETPVQVLLAHRDAPVPSMRALRPEVPEMLDAACQRMMAKRPEERPQSMREVTGLLEAWRTESTPSSAPTGVPAPPPVVAPARKRSSTKGRLTDFLRNVGRSRAANRRRARSAVEETTRGAGEKEADTPHLAPAGLPRSPWGRWKTTMICAGLGTVILAIAILAMLWNRKTPQPGRQPPAETASVTRPKPKPEPPEPPPVPADGYVLIPLPEDGRVDVRLIVDDQQRQAAEFVDPEAADQLKIPLQPGTHRLWIQPRGFEPVEETVAVQAGKSHAIDATWNKVELLAPAGQVSGESEKPPAQPSAEPEMTATPPAGAEATAEQTEPTAERPPSRHSKLPVPPPLVQDEMTTQLAEAHHLDQLRTPEQQNQLADTLVSEAAAAQQPNQRFVRLLMAAGLYLRAGNAAKTLDAAETAVGQFNIDLLTLLGQVIQRSAEGDTPGGRQRSCAELAMRLIDHLLANEEYQLAAGAADLLYQHSTGVSDAEFRRQCFHRFCAAKETYMAWQYFQEGTESLAENPEDSWAHLKVGRWRLLYQGPDSWPKALEHLAQGSDQRLKTAASKERDRRPMGAAEEIDLGETWFRLGRATRGSGRRVLLDRAKYWYEKALPRIRSARVRGMVNQRLEQITGAETERPWDPRRVQPIGRLKVHDRAVWQVLFSPDGSLLATCLEGVPPKLWILPGGQQLPVQLPAAGRVAFSPDGTALALWGPNAQVIRWNLPNGPVAWQVQHSAEWKGGDITWTPDGSLVASVGGLAEVRFWDVATGQPVSMIPFRGHGRGTVLALSADGLLAAMATDQPVFAVLDRASQSPRLQTSGHAAAVRALAFSPDNWLLVTASADKTIRLWDLTTGKVLRVLEGHRGPVTCVAISPDGCVLASGSEDETIILWDLTSGLPAAQLRLHVGPVFSLAFHPTGAILASGGKDGMVVSWGMARQRRRPRR